MTKNKSRILTSLVLGALLSTGIYANQQFSKRDLKEKHHKKLINKKNSILLTIKRLNLTTQQKEKIKTFIKEKREKTKRINQVFSKSSFDKKSYIEMMKNKRDNMIKSKADLIEKVYAILSIEQKEQLKILLDLKVQKGKF